MFPGGSQMCGYFFGLSAQYDTRGLYADAGRRRRFPPQNCARRNVGVRKVCATSLHETTPNCTNLAAPSNASRRNWE
jgi:hypothetical protein